MARNNLRKKQQREIALQRINYLFALAHQRAQNGQIDVASRYVFLARRLSMKYLVSMPAQHKQSYCKQCHCYLLPSKNSLIRLNRGHLSITCYNCGHIRRIPYTKSTSLPPKSS